MKTEVFKVTAGRVYPPQAGHFRQADVSDCQAIHSETCGCKFASKLFNCCDEFLPLVHCAELGCRLTIQMLNGWVLLLQKF